MLDRTGELERDHSDGLTELYRQHSAWLARRLRRRFGDDGEDIAHETWRRVLAAYGDGEGVRHPRALLLKVSARLGAGWTARGMRREALIEAADWAHNGVTEGGQETSVLLEQLILGLPDEVRDRIVIGEMRDGAAALETLKSWNTGHPGGLSTLHANSAEDVLRRLEDLIGEVVVGMPRRLIGQSVDRIVHISRTKEGRRVTGVLEVHGEDDGAYRIDRLA